MRQAAVAIAGREIDMYPGYVVGNEALQKARREDVVPFIVHRALHDVGNAAVQVAVEIRVHGKIPHPFAAALAGLQDELVPLAPIAEGAAHALGQRAYTGARECGEVQNDVGRIASGQRERVGQGHATLGIAVYDLDGDAVRRGR